MIRRICLSETARGAIESSKLITSRDFRFLEHHRYWGLEKKIECQNDTRLALPLLSTEREKERAIASENVGINFFFGWQADMRTLITPHIAFVAVFTPQVFLAPFGPARMMYLSAAIVCMVSRSFSR